MVKKWVLGCSASLIFAAAALSYPINIVNSFPLPGLDPLSTRGVYGWDYDYFWVIVAEGPGVNYLYKFNHSGSLVSTTFLPAAAALGDADNSPMGGNFAVLDEGAGDVKLYTTAGNFLGTFLNVPAGAVGIGVGGYTGIYAYVGMRKGLILKYDRSGSFLSSFTVPGPIADVAVTSAFGYWWGDYIYVGPRGPGPVRVYLSGGVLGGSFDLPGLGNRGAAFETGQANDYYWCLRDMGSQIQVFEVSVSVVMDVKPASLGRVKALFR